MQLTRNLRADIRMGRSTNLPAVACGSWPTVFLAYCVVDWPSGLTVTPRIWTEWGFHFQDVPQ